MGTWRGRGMGTWNEDLQQGPGGDLGWEPGLRNLDQGQNRSFPSLGACGSAWGSRTK
jgi:hypothetical protein